MSAKEMTSNREQLMERIDIAIEKFADPDVWEISRLLVDIKSFLSQTDKPKYKDGMYGQCSEGQFFPCRNYDNEFDWQIVHRDYPDKAGILLKNKACAFGFSAALNGHWDAAKVYLDDIISENKMKTNN